MAETFELKRLLVIFCFLAIGVSSFAQEEPRETYLVVRIQKQDDKRVDKIYYTIEAEPYNDHALDIYDLVFFNKNYFVPKAGIMFYHQRPDTATLYYNYFRSETEALDFMGKQKWTLVTVVNEIKSDYSIAPVSDRMPYTTISSRPVYYFKKTVDY